MLLSSPPCSFYIFATYLLFFLFFFWLPVPSSVLIFCFRESEAAGFEIGVINGLTALGNAHSRRGIPHLIRYGFEHQFYQNVLYFFLYIWDFSNSFDRYLEPNVEASKDMRVHINTAAAHGLRGIQGRLSASPKYCNRSN